MILISLTVDAADIYRATSDIKFRKSPSANSHAFGVIKEGSEIQIIDKSNSEWFKADYNGKIGFVSSKYLTLIQAKPTLSEYNHVYLDQHRSRFNDTH